MAQETAVTKVRVAFFGTPEFAASALRALLNSDEYEVCVVVTQPDRPAGRGGGLRQSHAKILALQAKIPVLQPLSVRKEGPAFIEAFDKHGPFDIGVVVAFGQILPVSVLDLPAAGSVNIHASLLPRWRGAAPIQRAIMEGDTQTGICLMKMESGLDTGPVYILEKLPITQHDTFGTLHDSLAKLGSHLLVQKLGAISRREINCVTQSLEGVTIARKIENTECKIEWTMGHSTLSYLIRGLSPAPGAFTFLHGKRLKIFNCSVSELEHASAAPGTVVAIHENSFIVACGNSALEITEVQIEGKNRLSASEFIRSGILSSGTILGN